MINLTPCDAKNPRKADANSCMKQNLNNILNGLADGSKTLNIPPLDPVKIPEFFVESNRNGFNFKVKIKNVVAHGGKNLRVTDVRHNLEVSSLTLTFLNKNCFRGKTVRTFLN